MIIVLILSIMHLAAQLVLLREIILWNREIKSEVKKHDER